MPLARVRQERPAGASDVEDWRAPRRPHGDQRSNVRRGCALCPHRMTLPDGGVAAVIGRAYVRMIEEVSFLSVSRDPRMLAPNYKPSCARPKRAGEPRLTKPGRNSMSRSPLRRAARDRGGVAERLKAADCKSADVRLRRFESYPLHQRSESAHGIEGPAQDLAIARGLVGRRNAGVAQWQSSSLPSWLCGFDSHHPLQPCAVPAEYAHQCSARLCSPFFG